MAEEFEDQGGVAKMDPGGFSRWLTSTVVRRACSPQRLEKQRAKLERARISAGKSHVVEYFHQVDDGYSHLTAQVLQQLGQRYDIELKCHLVHGPQGGNSAEPDLLLRLSRYDASHVAPEYGLQFPEHTDAPDHALVELATRVLAAQEDADFIECAAYVGDALWSRDAGRLQGLADSLGSASQEDCSARLQAGTERRSKLKHYSGAMFYYAGEWYWGVDRLYHLEKRLAELGADREPGEPMLVPRPAAEAGPLRDDGSLTLEVYPSLRSPYTAIVFDRVLELAKESGVNLTVHPVLPMVMRGVSLTREKSFYILSDTAREAREAGVLFGNFYDPIGNPVRRCYSLYPWACEQGRGNELLSSFLSAAFARGINTNSDRGLRKVVEAAGLDWSEARQHLSESGWEEILESNRLAMYDAGLWGVPSFRLLSAAGEQLLALWGQDRLWLIAREIQRQLAARQDT
ncbi:2-hydroxychromene-2-carboxylate isomerase [Pseudohalioglobus sediminis]|uniref:2-hydroxychromene-2-carboxylate isomerase n=1 Tax=Pseudohalioglobus sediminis TaxID=2606449 RepID=A0A5B0X2N7_9GAMM|nr:DsbA family protein [Pseudohalioglobus sediminis]KAA1192581.1 2-hydroxychromene-2-carboxylate isomerase [Pseudohalioglobus sediminis]